MRIIFDPQIFSKQIIGGISRYYVELIKGLLENGNEVVLPVKYSENVYLKELQVLDKQAENCTCKTINPSLLFLYNKLQRFKLFQVNENYCNRFIKNGCFDIVHPTFYDPYFLEHLKKKPYVLTIYDMINEKFTESYSMEKFTRWKKKLALNASAIIAISESTKKDIVNILGISEENVHVIHLASSLQRFNKEKMVLKLPSKYLLFTGLRNRYKNFQLFIEAVAPLLIEFQMQLICTGNKFTVEEKSYLKELNILDRVDCIHASDEELSMLYTNATAFVFPSLYEGFGIPILEAFNCGCPAIISNTSCFMEVASDAAEYFNPHLVESMRESVRKVVSNECYRSILQTKGYERACCFSWKKVVSETERIYNYALNKN